MAENTKAAALKRATGTDTKPAEDPKVKLREQFADTEVSAELGDVKVGVLVDVYPIVHDGTRHEVRRGQVVKVDEKVAARGEKFNGLIRL